MPGTCIATIQSLRNMIKWLIFIIIVYLGYRLFIGPPLLSERKTGRIRKENSDRDNDDFTDYEEIG